MSSRLVPTAPPQDVRGRARDSTSIEVSWRAPQAAHRNGQITGYKVIYAESSGGGGGGGGTAGARRGGLADPPAVIATSATEWSFLIRGLEKWTPYDVRVLASTRRGDGPPSDVIVVLTDEDGTCI